MRIYGKAAVIINTSSVVDLYGNCGQTNYAATKAGVVGTAMTWAKELGSKGVTVNAVTPGSIMSDAVAAMKERVPIKDLGEPVDVANAYLYLASDEAPYANDEVLSIDSRLTL